MAESGESKGQKRAFIVGMALRQEKANKHVSQKLIDHAALHGITLKVIDEHVPLDEQGHFDIILQKIRRKEWEDELEAYVAQHPHVGVHDMPKDTYVLRNRGTMLQPFGGSGSGTLFSPPPSSETAPSLPVRCSVPPHTTLDAGTSFEAAKTQLRDCGMVYPILAKSLWADGRRGSHALAIVHTEAGLQQICEGDTPQGLSLPLLFEQYVNHGTCLFKVYVLGDTEVMVTRPSLHLEGKLPVQQKQTKTVEQTPMEKSADNKPAEATTAIISCSDAAPVAEEEKQMDQQAELQSYPPDLEVVSRVSAYPRSRSWGKYDLAPRGHGVPPPPEWVWRGIAGQLREILGLTLFNFDLIVPLEPPANQSGLVNIVSNSSSSSSNGVKRREPEEGLIHLIDINYFPGIEKLPNYEALLVSFFESLRDSPSSS